MNTIELYKSNGNWMAHQEDAEIMELFSTYDIPTAFTSSADPKRVVAEIQRLNPGKVVILR